MRRIAVLVVFLLALGAPVFSGGQAETDEPVDVEFYFALGGELGELVEELVEEFNESQDEVTVDASFQGTYGETANNVMADLAGGNHPNLAMVSLGNVPQFLEVEGLVVDLFDYTDDPEFDIDDVIPALVDAGTFGDRFLALPTNTSTQIFYYNRDMFEEVGLDPDSPPQTWDEMREAAQVIADYDDDYYGYVGFGSPFEHWLLEYFFWANGGDILDDDGGTPVIDSRESIEAFEFLNTLVNEDESSIVVPYGDSLDLFSAGEAGMLIASTGSLGELRQEADFEIGTAPNPAGPEGAITSMGGGFLMMFDHGEAENDAAWEFMKFMVNTENTARMNIRTGYMPIRDSAQETDELREFWEDVPQARAAVDGLPGARARHTHQQLTEIHDILARAMDSAIIDATMTPAEALERAQEEAVEALGD